MRHLLLLLLPTVTLATIEIDLQGTIHSGVESNAANYKGFNERVIQEQDKAIFGIQNDSLNIAIEKINGQKPDVVYMTSATPFGDLHKRYGWKEVNVKIQPQLNDIQTTHKTVTTMLSKTEYENTNSRPKSTLINENRNLVNIIYSYWTQALEIKGGDETINFNFDIEDNKFYFRKILPIGVERMLMGSKHFETNATILLEPGQKVTAELEAIRRTIKIEIPYDVFVNGDVIAKYNRMYKGKYFFKFDINDVLKANNMTMTGRLQQSLAYQVLCNAELHIRDSAGVILRSIPAESKMNVTMNKHHDTVEVVPMKRKTTLLDIPDDRAFEIIEDDDAEESEENEKEKPEAPEMKEKTKK